MKYLSVFFTILLVWIAALLIAAFRPTEAGMTLFLMTVGCTLILFLIGFAKK